MRFLWQKNSFSAAASNTHHYPNLQTIITLLLEGVIRRAIVENPRKQPAGIDSVLGIIVRAAVEAAQSDFQK